MIYEADIPIEPHAKERPRFGSGRAYNSKRYTDWRKRFVALAPRVKQPMSGALEVSIFFHTKSGKMRPDLDNAAAGVCDALQDAGVIANDRDIVDLHCSLYGTQFGNGPSIHVYIRERK
jgi:Holliday junction resolvase RusA-like endonuclease